MHEGDSVTEDLTNKEQSIRTQFERSEQELSDLEQNLQGVNSELVELAEKSHEFDVLGEVCRSLAELENLGAADLFWNSQDDVETRGSKLASAQQKIDEYSAEINRVEDRRDSVLEQIGDQNQTLDSLHGSSSAMLTKRHSTSRLCRGHATTKKTSASTSLWDHLLQHR